MYLLRVTPLGIKEKNTRLEDASEGAAPSRHGGDAGTVGVDLLPVVLTETSIEIDLVNGEPTSALPEVTAGPEDEDDGNGKAGHEEVLSSAGAGLAVGHDGNEDLGNQDDSAESETHVRAVDTTSSVEGDLVERATLPLPGSAETNVALGGVSVGTND